MTDAAIVDGDLLDQQVDANGYRSMAFPSIGAGSGGMSRERVLRIVIEAFAPLTPMATVRRFQAGR